MKKKSALVVCSALTLLLLAAQAQAGILDWLRGQLSKAAVDYGLWYCTNCQVPAPGVPIDTLTSPSDITAFIKYNNFEIHESKNETVHRWIPNSKISVCNSANNCLTVIYQAQGFWLPAAGSYPVPPGKTPKVPKNPEVSQTPPNVSRPGRVVLSPIGLPVTTSQWTVTLPETTRRVVTPSVTIIQDGVSTTYVGSPVDLGGLNNPVGNTLNWGIEAIGLDVGGGSCRYSACALY
jgi:hypothetical protein